MPIFILEEPPVRNRSDFTTFVLPILNVVDIITNFKPIFDENE